jgi:hypothetical protein
MNMSNYDAQPQRGQGNNDSGKTGGTSGSFQSAKRIPAEDSVTAELVPATRTLFDERLGAVTDLRLGGYRTNADFEPWTEDESLNIPAGPYDRAAWSVDNAETITERVAESDGIVTVQVLRLPAARHGAPSQTLRTKMSRTRDGDRLWMELWDGSRWNALDEVDLGPWTEDEADRRSFRSAQNREAVLRLMGTVRLAAQRQAVAIIS